MFDKDLHTEYVYCSFLVGMLPVEPVPMEDIEKMLSLEMYKLEKTFDGDISLGDESGVYAPAEPKGASKPEDKDPLDEIIERINEKYKSDIQLLLLLELGTTSGFFFSCKRGTGEDNPQGKSLPEP